MPLHLTDFTEPSLGSARAVSSAELIVEELACRRGERVVFAGLSFWLPPGGALVLTGANGSGKSSLLRLVGRPARRQQQAACCGERQGSPTISHRIMPDCTMSAISMR